ncbi:MerR family transcriptional regulator [Frankia sp. AgB32]|nr:MerR family transcriptional regulator [Frankia sp. AgB32]MCK9893780.1 MerR family transcriptional regulator [Frankia sp. AgB32]
MLHDSQRYRRYSPHQLERARLVAWLRRLDMPLARIRRVCGLDPAAAATEIGLFWAEAERTTAARRPLAAGRWPPSSSSTLAELRPGAERTSPCP